MSIRAIQIFVLLTLIVVGFGIWSYQSQNSEKLKSSVSENTSTETTVTSETSSSTEVLETVKSSEPTVSVNVTEAVKPTETSASTQVTEEAKPPETVKSSEPALPAESTSSEQGTEMVKPSPSEPTQTVQASDASKPSEPALISLSSSAPLRIETENGLPKLIYIAAYDEKSILDGLQVGNRIASISTPVQWSGPSGIILEDSKSVRTYFIAPKEDRALAFTLELLSDEKVEKVAIFHFTIVSPLVKQVDHDADGAYTFSDLLFLLQNWDRFGGEAAKAMALILSQYHP